MNDLLSSIHNKKEQLDLLRPLPPALVKSLDAWFKVELTYTSNAIEGNTLTRNEVALVIEKGVTIVGKTIQEHLEAINHAFAIDFVKELSQKNKRAITNVDIRNIQRILLKKIDNANAGKWRAIAVEISGSRVKLPHPIKVLELMDDFIHWLHESAGDPVTIAADAHLKLVTIHPFVDGNGRTARLLMNLLLMQEGYPPAIIRTEDRALYIHAIEKTQLHNDKDDYYRIMYEAVNRSLDIYLDAAQKSI